MKKIIHLSKKYYLFGLCSSSTWKLLDACTRVVYKGPENNVITARSMDWKDEIDANLWAFPRGMQRDGNVGANSIKWTSKIW
jgi:choloylglycine hydrolase